MSRYLDLIDDVPATGQHKPELLQLLGERGTLVSDGTHYGKGYVHANGRIEDGTPDPMPRPVVGWPSNLTSMLNRVASFFEWSQADRQDFIAWARRSCEGLADAGLFLQTEIEKLERAGGGSNL